MTDVYNADPYKQSCFLAILTRDGRNRLRSKLKPVTLKLGSLRETGAPMVNPFYFSTTTVVSTVAVTGKRLGVESCCRAFAGAR